LFWARYGAAQMTDGRPQTRPWRRKVDFGAKPRRNESGYAYE
jgi:hypothetical protein